ncbi:MAG: DUF1858 domain-containing protein [Candidatus Micrarchaeia archaeon]
MKTRNLITRETPIGEIASNYTKPIEILMSYGFHCIGCGASGFESVEAGAMVHGLDDKEIDKLVEELNQAANEETAEKGGKPKKKAAGCECVEEAVVIRKPAADKIKGLMAAEGKNGWGLRLSAVQTPTGDYDYELDFEKAQKKGDLSVKVEGGMLVFFEKRLEKTVSGIVIDYKKGANGEDVFTMKKAQAHSHGGNCGC